MQAATLRLTASRIREHRSNVLALAFAFSGYAFAGVTVPTMLLFFGGWWLPRTVDRGPETHAGIAVAVDVTLMLVFALQHSVMARTRVKARIAALMRDCERTTYVFASCLSIWALMLLWRPIDATLWTPPSPVRAIGGAGFWLGVAVTYIATFTLGHAELLGLREVWGRVSGRRGSGQDRPLQTRGVYRLVRHPLMSGLLLCCWCAPEFTAGRLLLAFGMTVYVVVGTRLEERDLHAGLGSTYTEYVESRPAFVPWRLARRGGA